jgi:hypothetical protein
MVGVKLPEWAKGRFPRILCGANPGNIGHLFVKRMFVDGAQPMELRPMPPEEGGKVRQYIPAVLEDNPSMAEDDPTYEHTLTGMGSPELVKAMRWGDWNVVLGAFFSMFDERRHIIEPFKLPDTWLKFAAHDWGSASPGCVGWYAVVGEPFVAHNRQGKPVLLPRGCLAKYQEWYIANADGTGLKLRNEAIAKGVLEREKAAGHKIAYRVADPSIWNELGGPSIAEDYARAGCHFTKADNARTSRGGGGTAAPISGLAQMISRLTGDGDGNPMLVFASICRDSIRTIPILMHDEHDPENLDTDMEDHAADETRYACMSRPWVPGPPAKKDKFDGWRQADRKTETNWKTI